MTLQPANDKDDTSAALVPAAGIPLLYFGFAHACLALAFAICAIRPTLPGGFFLHARMVAAVHLVTLGWISGSILGAFYIVGPLALRMPLRPRWRDRAAFASFAVGVVSMVAYFWMEEYGGIAWAAVLVMASVLHVALRVWRGLGRAVAPRPVKLHVAFAFTNMLAASLLGMLIGLNRVYGWLPWSPLSASYGHAHLAAVGWVAMMVLGLSYRLIPMFLPAATPARGSMAGSAFLLQAGVTILTVALIRRSAWTSAGALLIVAGFISFAVHVRLMLRRRRPPPAALPRPDWATWQTQVALLWLLVAAALGIFLATLGTNRWTVELGWIYGTLGLAGFLAQIVVGIQGRLLPMHAWYRAFERGGRQPPARSAHTLASPALARLIFIAWMIGVPTLALGLASAKIPAIAAAGGILFVGVILNAAQGARIVRHANAATRGSR